MGVGEDWVTLGRIHLSEDAALLLLWLVSTTWKWRFHVSISFNLLTEKVLIFVGSVSFLNANN
jgi:hypothetical protein